MKDVRYVCKRCRRTAGAFAVISYIMKKIKPAFCGFYFDLTKGFFFFLHGGGMIVLYKRDKGQKM